MITDFASYYQTKIDIFCRIRIFLCGVVVDWFGWVWNGVETSVLGVFAQINKSMFSSIFHGDGRIPVTVRREVRFVSEMVDLLRGVGRSCWVNLRRCGGGFVPATSYTTFSLYSGGGLVRAGYREVCFVGWLDVLWDYDVSLVWELGGRMWLLREWECLNVRCRHVSELLGLLRGLDGRVDCLLMFVVPVGEV